MHSEELQGLRARLGQCLEDVFAGKPARLASAAGIGESTVRGWFEKWNAGESVNPNGIALYKVAQACGVSVEWLLTGNEIEAGFPKTSTSERYFLKKALDVLRSGHLPGDPAKALEYTIEALHALAADKPADG